MQKNAFFHLEEQNLPTNDERLMNPSFLIEAERILGKYTKFSLV